MDEDAAQLLAVSQYGQWRTPRPGTENPSLMNNPVWIWLIKTGHSAYMANQLLGADTSGDEGPAWCFDRLGQSLTVLPDGRQILIAGEHEDFYDPDFHIYNDVVVMHPDGRVDIYGYPYELFPPTDFHSATLVGNEIILIGSLGYRDSRSSGETQVLSLNTEALSIRRLHLQGTPPGWIYQHEARLDEGGASITITGGILDHGADRPALENLDDWKLDLVELEWHCITRRNWPRWQIARADGSANQLWDIRQALFQLEMGWKPDLEQSLSELQHKLGMMPDIQQIETLYRPQLPHEVISRNEDEHATYRIRINGCVVRYVEDFWQILITIEGELPEQIQAALIADLECKLTELEGTTYSSQRLS